MNEEELEIDLDDTQFIDNELDDIDFSDIEDDLFDTQAMKQEILEEVDKKIELNNSSIKSELSNNSSYSGWLVSSNIFKRSLGVFFHFLIGYILVGIVVSLITAAVVYLFLAETPQFIQSILDLFY